MEIYKKNKKIFEGRIIGNLDADRKSDIKRRRDSINKDERVDGEWVFEQYKKQNGLCANPRCNYKLNNIFEEEEIMGCWRVTSVNRINNNFGHTKNNCNLMHLYCNMAMEWNDYPCYLFKCKRYNCECYEKYEKVFERIGHPENIDNNISRMKHIMQISRTIKRRIKRNKLRRRIFTDKNQVLILETKYLKVMSSLRENIKEKKALIKKNQLIKRTEINTKLLKKIKVDREKKKALIKKIYKMLLK
jgi:hypothetical protein